MRTPIFIRPLTEDEQQPSKLGLRSSDAFVMRRCQMVLASARGERAPQDCARAGLRRPDRAQCHPCLQRTWAGGAAAGSPRPHRLTPPSPPRPPSACEPSCTAARATFGLDTQSVDAGPGRPDQLPARLDRRKSATKVCAEPSSDWKSNGSGPNTGSPAPTAVPAKKSQRDRLIAWPRPIQPGPRLRG